MSAPLHEQPRLKHFIQSWNHGDLPLGCPSEPSAHQGLSLSNDGDTLIGRADNGGVL